MPKQKSLFRKSGAMIILASLFGCALIFAHPITALKLRDKPPSWKITGEGYGVGWQFRFERSRPPAFYPVACSASCWGEILQRNNFEPIYYRRKLSGRWPIDPLKAPSRYRNPMFPELG